MCKLFLWFYQGARVELSAKNLKVMDQMPPSAPRYAYTAQLRVMQSSAHNTHIWSSESSFLFLQALQVVFATLRWRTMRALQRIFSQGGECRSGGHQERMSLILISSSQFDATSKTRTNPVSAVQAKKDGSDKRYKGQRTN